MTAGRPRKYDTREELEEAIKTYFDGRQPEVLTNTEGEPLFDNKGKPLYRLNPPTITGLALHLGFCSRISLYDYEKESEFSYTIKLARLRCENFAEDALLSAQCPPAAGIFILKNYGWSDKQEIEHSGGQEIVYLDKQDEEL